MGKWKLFAALSLYRNAITRISIQWTKQRIKVGKHRKLSKTTSQVGLLVYTSGLVAPRELESVHRFVCHSRENFNVKCTLKIFTNYPLPMLLLSCCWQVTSACGLDLWPFISWSMVIHGGSHIQPLHQVRRSYGYLFLSYEFWYFP